MRLVKTYSGKDAPQRAFEVRGQMSEICRAGFPACRSRRSEISAARLEVGGVKGEKVKKPTF